MNRSPRAMKKPASQINARNTANINADIDPDRMKVSAMGVRSVVVVDISINGDIVTIDAVAVAAALVAKVALRSGGTTHLEINVNWNRKRSTPTNRK
jgi:hypothetical protein